MKINKYILITLGVIVLDQVIKMLVHFNMDLGFAGEINVIADKFRLHYIHNPGMAFGLTIEHRFGKLILSLFRIVAISALAYFFFIQIKRKAHKGFLICLALILGGAIGNGIDSVFYGVFFDITTPNAMTPWLHGMVIDMLYFPMFDGTFPQWFPARYAGRDFTFFSAIFNIADSAIFIGALSILIFNKKFFTPIEESPEDDAKDAEMSEEAIALAAASESISSEPNITTEEISEEE